MLPELRKQIYVNYFMKNEICKLNYVNQNKNRRTFQNTQNTEEKTFVSEQMPGRHYKFPGFFACYPMTKEPGSFFRIHLLLLFR